LPKLHEFWKCVKEERKPELTIDDYKHLKIAGRSILFKKLSELHSELLTVQNKYNELREKCVKDLPEKELMQCSGVLIYNHKENVELIFPKENQVLSTNPLKDIWNEHCGDLPKIKTMGKGIRRESAKARWQEKPAREYWEGIVKNLASSPFCNGSNDREWKASFDFLIRPDTHIKASEGKYSGKTNTKIRDLLE
jgi:hypothetical protein